MVFRWCAFFLSLFTVGLNQKLCAQGVFSATYEVGYNNISWVRGVPTADGGFLISARPTGDSLSSFAASILTVDSLGDEPTIVRYEHGGSDLITCMERMSSGDLIVGSSTSGHFGTSGMEDMMFRRLGPDGAVVWAKVFAVDGAMESSVRDIVQPLPGTLIACGWFVDTLEHGHAMLFRMSQDGGVEWVREIIPEVGSLQLRSLSVDPSGGVVALGSYAIQPGASNMLLMHVDLSGDITWAHQYGSIDHNEPSIAIVDPTGGWVLLGRFGGPDSPGGAIIRTDDLGDPTSMMRWGSRIVAGHAFVDGSLLLMSELSQDCAFVRLYADLTIPWWTTVHATSWGELIPFDEGTRFAYVSSELFDDVTINTLTSECEACNTSPPSFPIVEETWVDHGYLEVYASPKSMASADIGMQATPLPTTRSMVCSQGVGIRDAQRNGTLGIECQYDRNEHTLVVHGLPNESKQVVLFDMRGEQVGCFSTNHVDFSSSSAHFRIPEQLCSGVYSARDPLTGNACRFMALPY